MRLEGWPQAQKNLRPSFEARPSQSAVTDFDTLGCGSRARPTSVGAPELRKNGCGGVRGRFAGGFSSPRIQGRGGGPVRDFSSRPRGGGGHVVLRGAQLAVGVL